MIIREREVLRLFEQYPTEEIHFKFYDAHTETGLSQLDTYVLAKEAKIKEQPGDKIKAEKLVEEAFEDIAYFSLENGEVLAKREAKGHPMVSFNDVYFQQDEFNQAVEDDLYNELKNRGMINPELSEKQAKALLSGVWSSRISSKKEEKEPF